MPSETVAKTPRLRLRPKLDGSVPKTAMILAAGLGRRMAPLTDDRPKALVEVAGRSLIDHALDRLEEAGVERVVVNLHAHADRLAAHLAARGGKPEILFSDEREKLLDTGGAIKKARPLLGEEPVLIVNGDAFWRDGLVNTLSLLAHRWTPSEMDALLLIVKSFAALGYDGRGDFLMDGLGRLTRRAERVTSSYVFGGVQILKPQLADRIDDEIFSLRRIWFDLAEAERLFGVIHEGLWAHVGTPAARRLVDRHLVE